MSDAATHIVLLVGNRMVAVYQHSTAYKVTRHLQRRSQTLRAMAFDVWVQYIRQCHQMRVLIHRKATKVAFTKMTAAFKYWRQWAAASAGISSGLRSLIAKRPAQCPVSVFQSLCTVACSAVDGEPIPV